METFIVFNVSMDYICRMKNKILNKAVDLFLNFGFKSVTMDEIANELGMSKKTIYSHFPTKLKLVEASTFHMFDRINKGMCSICAGEINPIEEIYSIKSLVMEQLKGQKTSPQYQLQKYYPRIFKALTEKKFETINGCILDNLKRGKKQGLYRSELNEQVIARFYFTGVIGIQNAKVFPMEEFDAAFLKDYYLEYHLRAITTEKGLKTLLKIINK